MTILTKPSTLIQKLKELDIFKGIDDAALNWLIEKSDYKQYEVGDMLFVNGQATNHMIILLEGKYSLAVVTKGQIKDLGFQEKGYVTGVLPFSRMKKASASGRIIEPTQTLELHKDHFLEMVNTCYELTERLVNIMSNRIRQYSQVRFQDEKLTALGRLSAGLAHELNNPAAAIVRDVEELYQKTHATPEKFKAVITMKITPEETDQVNAILFSKLKNLHQIDLSLLEQEAAAEDLSDWLEERGLEADAEDIADTFVDFGITVEDLEQVNQIIKGRHLPAIMRWFDSTLSMEKIVTDIREASNRIASLIGAVKSYTHMDRGAAAEKVVIHEGIKSTLIMLKHKIKSKNIQIKKNLDPKLPRITARPGELNQVWTNIFDNAIDAMEDKGTLGIHTFQRGDFVCIDISDTGSGIPEEDLTVIFEPFYTTKDVGQGTGLGLDVVKKIVDQHNGTIKVNSKPGKTVFELCFPIDNQAYLPEKPAPNKPAHKTDK